MSDREHLIKVIRDKAAISQSVYDRTLAVFSSMKEILQEYSVEANELLEGSDRKIRFVYQDRGKFEAQVQVASDVLFFSMHTNTFLFCRDNEIWNSDYVKENNSNAYVGIISIYDFLADSLKYNRNDDEGYLVARIFVNREGKYMVEGKGQAGMPHNHFGDSTIDDNVLTDIFEKALEYAVGKFDLLVPPYDLAKRVSLEQINTKIEHSKLRTGKRLGYSFELDEDDQ